MPVAIPQRVAEHARMAPSYTNIMTDVEEQMLASITARPMVWWRFIDGIFAIWKDGIETLLLFLNESDQFHHTIKFTAEWSGERVSFLDTTVILDNTTIHTDLHTKPTVPLPSKLPPETLHQLQSM